MKIGQHDHASIPANCASAFSRFWEVHPRPRDRERSLNLFAAAMAEGVRPEWIVAAAARYGAAKAGEARQYLAASDIWLANRRWEDFVDRPGLTGFQRHVERTAAFWAEKMRVGRYVPASAITPEVAAFMVASGLAEEAELRRIGVWL